VVIIDVNTGQILLFYRTRNTLTLPGLTLRRCGPHTATGTVLEDCENIRLRINPANQVSLAGWGREGCNPSCLNNESKS
jgi:hypothetical protein